jgi:hypothetical protein
MSQHRTTRVVSVVLGALALLAACAESPVGSSDTESATVSATAASVPETSSVGSVPPTTVPAATDPAATDGSATTMGNPQIDPGLKPYIDIAVADLAQRLSVDANEIEVSSATLVEWPDSSLGCPQPGMQYAQTLTDGARIVLNSRGKQYSYHAGGSRPPFLCEQPVKEPPTTG